MKLIDQIIISQISEQLDYDELGINHDLLVDKEIAPHLKNYLALTHLPNKFQVDETNLFYNRYFWFKKLQNTYLQKHRTDDLNLEQQSIKILESAPNVDWKIIEEIENQF